MGRDSGAADIDANGNERLLLALAEDLKAPLLKIAYSAEMAASMTGAGQATDIQHTAFSAIRFIDSYLLSAASRHGQLQLGLEPVVLGAVMQDAMQRVMPISRQYNCNLLLEVGHRQPPVMANRAALEAALANLLTVFIESGVNNVQMNAYRSHHGITTGVFTLGSQKISSAALAKARLLYGVARQPMPEVTAGSGSGLFVADALISSMQTHLKPAKHGEWHGLAASFVPSAQMQLV